MQVAQLLHNELGPDLEVLGSQYPPAPWRASLAQGAGLVQMAALGGVMFGERLFEAAGVQPVPQWYADNVAANRFGAGIGVWLVGNMASNQLISTGAFEVYYDGTLVFSKLETGRMPTAGELLDALGGRRQSAAADGQAAGAAHGDAAADALAAAAADRRHEL